MRYLLDSNTLIEAKNLHYRPSFCQSFWDWIIAGHTANKFFSIDIVQKELLAGDADDLLHMWAKSVKASLPGFFISTKGCSSQWGALTAWVTNSKYKEAAIKKFLNRAAADAWLIAYALQNKGTYTIVTNEIAVPSRISSIQLPDAAQAFGVPSINLYDLLSRHGANNFSFQP
ncbi:DUF4411 family protein [Paenalcaligenes hominis]|uniref:DUF4411 family protein n=1 Tax=Paenalcaligenes hominis TaxID=643674 RepID=UPI003525C953